MRGFRTILIVVGVIAVLAAIGGGAVFYFTSGAVDAANRFFATIASSGPGAAYSQLAPAFRAATAQDEFANVAERLRLDTYRSASWSSRSVKNAAAELEGTLTLAEGSRLPITVDLVKDEGGTWRVLSFKTASAGVQ